MLLSCSFLACFPECCKAARAISCRAQTAECWIGATEEHVGFRKANTASAVCDLTAFGTSLVPELSAASFERAWSGLRPGSADGLPYLGQVSGHENLFVAAGHFRSGLQMSPGTARLMRQALLDQETDFELEPFSCERGRSALSL